MTSAADVVIDVYRSFHKEIVEVLHSLTDTGLTYDQYRILKGLVELNRQCSYADIADITGMDVERVRIVAPDLANKKFARISRGYQGKRPVTIELVNPYTYMWVAKAEEQIQAVLNKYLSPTALVELQDTYERLSLGNNR